jgi:hypothetical protein
MRRNRSSSKTIVRSRHTISAAIALGIVCWLGSFVSAQGQGAASAAAPTADQVFKNIQVLKGIPVDQFMDAMGMFSSSLGYDCSSCHSQEIHTDRAAFAITTPLITRARQMIAMMNGINETNFGGRPRVTCYTCHRTSPTPDDVPSLAAQYADVVDDPNAMALVRSRTVTADQVFAKYVQALGGQVALQNAKTRVMTGTVTNRDLTTANLTMTEKNTGEARIELATQPNPTIRATNGTASWQIGGGGPGGGVNARDITGFQVQQGFRLADFALPLHLKERYPDLSVKPAYETVDGKPAVVLTGSPYPHVTEELAFDRESGLLLRHTITSGTAGGFGIMALGEQIDYSDYRDVSGVKVPFALRHSTWNAVTTEKLSDVKINAPVADTIFAKPAPQQ